MQLKLVSSPSLEAGRILEDLSSNDILILKKATFLLQKYIKEVEFADQFLFLGGLRKLEDVIEKSEGNTLAYALTSLQNLMEHDHGWDDFDSAFISTVSYLFFFYFIFFSPHFVMRCMFTERCCYFNFFRIKLVSIIVKQNLVNICRPATAIIIKLVISDVSSTNFSTRCYGFEVVNKAISAQSSFLPTLVQRLTTTDYLLALNSLNLINALFRHVTDRYRVNFVYTMDCLNIRKVAMRLMQASPAEEMYKQLVEFQRLMIQEGHRRKRLLILAENPTHDIMLNEIWALAAIKTTTSENSDGKWKKIGFAVCTPYLLSSFSILLSLLREVLFLTLRLFVCMMNTYN